MTYFLIEIQIFILVTLISCSKDLNFRISYEKLYLFYRKNYNISHNDLRKKKSCINDSFSKIQTQLWESFSLVWHALPLLW